jgi:hypothetical protein
MSNEVPLENLVEENDDLIKLNSIEDTSICMGRGKKKVQKRRKTSEVWNYFDRLPSSGQPDDKLRAKCKACGTTYIAESTYGTGNLRRHKKLSVGKHL